MVIIPTKRFWAFVAMGIPIAMLGAVIPGAHWWLVPYNLGLLVIFFVTGRLALKSDQLKVTRKSQSILSVRVPNAVRLTVENLTVDRLRFQLRDEPPTHATATNHEFDVTLEPERVREFDYTITPYERGDGSFGDTWLRIMAPLGLAWAQKLLPTGQAARVYPNVQAVKEYELLKQKGHLSLMGVRKSRIKGLGQEFESLREYNEDDYRMIDWKASARRNKLVVKNFEQEKNQAVIICVDVGRHMLSEVAGVRKLDYCLDSSLMLMHAAERAGDQVGLLVFNDVIKRYIVPKKGRHQIAAILDTIHAVQAEPVQPNYQAAFAYLSSRWKRRSLIVVFSDAENEDQANELVASLSHLNRRHLLMVVRVGDPRMRELTQKAVSRPEDLYDRASALWYVADRRKAEIRLRAAGFQTIEAEPEELSAALVRAYLRVKELSLI